jgi:hypothetical protein
MADVDTDTATPDAVAAPITDWALQQAQQDAAQAQQTQPVTPTPTPQTTAVIPPQQPQQIDPASPAGQLQAAAVHHSRLSSILDSVGNLLGGSTTIHATKHPDGSVEITHDPSTNAEKWGRVASAALTGLAKGFTVSQGPGGAGRAAGAGFEAGAAMPQQRQQQAQQQVDEANTEMMNKANHALLDQKIVAGTWDAAHRGIEWNEKQANYAMDMRDRLDNSGAKLIAADVRDPQTMASYGMANPDAMAAHVGSDGSVLQPIPNGQGGIDFYHIPPDVAKQRVTEDSPFVRTIVDPHDSTKTIDIPDVTPANTATHGDLALRDKGLIAANGAANQTAFENRMKQQKADQEAAEGPVTLAQKRAETARAYAEAGKAKAETEALGGGGDAIKQNAAMMVEGLSAPSQMSKRAKEYNQLLPAANAYSLAKYGVPFDAEVSEGRYKARTAVQKDFASGKEADQIQSFNTFLGHAENLSNSVNALRNTNSPLINTQYNVLRNMTGDPAVKAILPQIEAVRKEYQNFLSNNLALHNADINEGSQMIDEKASPAQMQAAIKSFTHTALTRVGTLNDRYRRTMGTDVPNLLNDGSIRAIGHFGLQPYAAQVLAPPAQPGAAPAAVPSGAATQPAGTKDRSVSAAMAMPINQGKTQAQVTQDLQAHGYNPVP